MLCSNGHLAALPKKYINVLIQAVCAKGFILKKFVESISTGEFIDHRTAQPYCSLPVGEAAARKAVGIVLGPEVRTMQVAERIAVLGDVRLGYSIKEKAL